MAYAITYSQLGDPSVLTMTEVPEPTAGAGELVVKIEAAGVNPIDAKLRKGLRASGPITEPRRVGFDGAGVVTAVGAGVSGFEPGDRVAIHDSVGTYATALAVKADKAFVLPENVSFAAAAGIGIPVGTAYQSLRSLGVGVGDIVLIHAGSGAVGQAAVQYAVAWGATVIATASPARHDQLRQLGAIPVAYGPGLTERVREIAPDGVNVAYDCAGTDEAIQTSLDLVADRNRIATIVRGGDAAGFGIRAFSGGSPVALTDEELAWRAEAIPETIALLERDEFVIELGPEFALADAARAHELIETGAAGGKIVLLP
jgi:NADPH2:quinone reductase